MKSRHFVVKEIQKTKYSVLLFFRLILYLESIFSCALRPAINVVRLGNCNEVWSIFDNLNLGTIEELVCLINNWSLVVFNGIFGPNSKPIIWSWFFSVCSLSDIWFCLLLDLLWNTWRSLCVSIFELTYQKKNQ
jgi:hypothetical protein